MSGRVPPKLKHPKLIEKGFRYRIFRRSNDFAIYSVGGVIQVVLPFDEYSRRTFAEKHIEGREKRAREIHAFMEANWR